MNTGLSVVTPATEEPVTLAELKAHLRVTDTAEDDYITGLGIAARSLVDDSTARVALTTTFKLTLPGFSCPGKDWRTIALPRSALQSVDHVKYYDVNGDLQTLAADQYGVLTDREPGNIFLKSAFDWPTTEERPDAVEIQFKAGWADAEADLVDEEEPFFGDAKKYKLAVKFLVAHWFELRTPVQVGNIVTPIPDSLQTLINSVRVWYFA